MVKDLQTNENYNNKSRKNKTDFKKGNFLILERKKKKGGGGEGHIYLYIAFVHYSSSLISNKNGSTSIQCTNMVER